MNMSNQEHVIHDLWSPSVLQWEIWHVPEREIGEVRIAIPLLALNLQVRSIELVFKTLDSACSACFYWI